MTNDNLTVQSRPSRREPRRISKNQAAVLAALFSVYDKTGFCPSYRELAPLAGLGSAGAVSAKIAILERRGLVTRTHLRRSRNIIVTEEGKLALQSSVTLVQSNSSEAKREVNRV